jgi:hypothetical protein
MDIKAREYGAFSDSGVRASLDLLQLDADQLLLAGGLRGDDLRLDQDPTLELDSGPNSWSWPLTAQGGGLEFRGGLPIRDLTSELTLSLRSAGRKRSWLCLTLIRTAAEEQQQWLDFFAGRSSTLPGPDLERIANSALQTIRVQSASASPEPVTAFCRRAASQDLVVDAARLRHQGRFPSVLGHGDGEVLASRLVLNWNLLLIQEGSQRFLVLQGVSSSDALLLPGLNLMVLVCHIDVSRVVNCMQILCRDPEFFVPPRPAVFAGYLVGHSRPYHCFYDGLLGLQHLLESGELSRKDSLFSKQDEAFVDLGAALHLQQPHQLRSREELNDFTRSGACYLLQVGFLFHTRAEQPSLRRLAAAVDAPLRELARKRSTLAAHGDLDALERCKPLLWVGITGQKRSWLEQVEGTAALLNTLQQVFPNLGVVFDGWTPPLESSDYHRKEARKDDRVIQRIIRRLSFQSRQRLGVVAGLPMLEKIRVGQSVDAFVANYTTGSLNVARICEKPGVGHMGRQMAASKHQHIHHHTREVPSRYIRDRGAPGTPTGYINYSLPWQVVYNILLDILRGLALPSVAPLEPLDVPELR